MSAEPAVPELQGRALQVTGTIVSNPTSHLFFIIMLSVLL
jgi:hypothetical protein